MDAQRFRERLETERTEVSETLRRIVERLAMPQAEGGGEIAVADQHPADAASETESRELDMAQQRMFQGRLVRIEEALRRIAKGTYGRCVVCGNEIPDERLEIIPDTPYCVKDAPRGG